MFRTSWRCWCPESKLDIAGSGSRGESVGVAAASETDQGFSMKLYIAALLALVLAGTGYSGELKPFASDGCSAFPDGTFEQRQLWLSCCIEHDRAYWRGGTRKERINADKRLKACVEAVGEPAIARLMMAGVRVGGTPYLPTKFRWGYGWPYLRGYKALTDEEQEQVREALEAYDAMNGDSGRRSP